MGLLVDAVGSRAGLSLGTRKTIYKKERQKQKKMVGRENWNISQQKHGKD